MQCIAIWRSTVIHLLSISTWQEQLLSITCLRQVIWYPALYIQLSVFHWVQEKKKKTSTLTFLVLPAPLIHVQPFEKSKDSWETRKTGQRQLTPYLLYAVHCTLFIPFSYCRHFPDIRGTFVLHRPWLCFDFPTQARWSHNRLFVRCSAWTMNVYVIYIMFDCRCAFVWNALCTMVLNPNGTITMASVLENYSEFLPGII